MTWVYIIGTLLVLVRVGWRSRQWLWDNRQRMLQSHALQAIIIGLLSLGVSLLIYFLLWNFWYQRDNISNEEYRALELSFSQTFASYATIFVAGALGWLAIQEFREDHQQAEIEVTIPYSNHGTDVEPLLHVRPSRDHYLLSIRAKNNGKFAASNYTIQISLPFLHQMWRGMNFKEPTKEDVLEFLRQVMPVYEGKLDENWQVRYNPKVVEENGRFSLETGMLLIFRSHQTVTLFPKRGVNLAVIKLTQSYMEKDKKQVVEYTAAGDQTKATEGTLSLIFR